MVEAVQFSGIGAAANVVRDHIILNHNEFPEHVQERLFNLTRIGKSPVDLIVGFTEAVYANRSEFDETSQAFAAGTADLIDANGFNGRLNDRAAAIGYVLRNTPGFRQLPPEEEPKPDELWIPSTVPDEQAAPSAGEVSN